MLTLRNAWEEAILNIKLNSKAVNKQLTKGVKVTSTLEMIDVLHREHNMM
jgi:hypothetical protein